MRTPPAAIPGQLGVSLREAAERINEAMKPELDPVKRLGVIGVAMAALLHAERDALYQARHAPRTLAALVAASEATT